jgi:hypothetical protein
MGFWMGADDAIGCFSNQWDARDRANSMIAQIAKVWPQLNLEVELLVLKVSISSLLQLRSCSSTFQQ